MCPLVKELKNRSSLRTMVCMTGQHREMLTSVLKVFEVKPDYDLCVMKEHQTLGEITSQVLTCLYPVLVHGDTTQLSQPLCPATI